MSRIRVAIAGCGNVSNAYIPHLQGSPFVDLVAVCDQHERVDRQGEKFGIDARYSALDRMMSDVEFELFVNLTSMPSHGELNRIALEAGKYVWSEKPMASDTATARELVDLADRKRVKIWGAPNTTTSPAFALARDRIASGSIGTVHAAHGIYGHHGPEWGAWVYGSGGGSLWDLGVYNLTTLTGLLGPVESVTAEMRTAIPERRIDGKPVRVEADDNVALIMNHGDGVLSVVQTGFVYGAQKEDFTVQVIGTHGAIAIGGYDWDPLNVQIFTAETNRWVTCAERTGSRSLRDSATQPDSAVTARTPADPTEYAWQGGATYIAECLATGRDPIIRADHTLHVMEIMDQARVSSRTGRRCAVQSAFEWPAFGEGGKS